MNNLEKEFLNSKSTIQKEDWRKDLAYKKFEYQKQKDTQKLNEKQQKEAERKRQARQELIGSLLSIAGKVFVFTCKATAYMILAPIFLVLCFCGGFAGGMIKLK